MTNISSHLEDPEGGGGALGTRALPILAPFFHFLSPKTLETLMFLNTSVCPQRVPCDHYPWCIGPHLIGPTLPSRHVTSGTPPFLLLVTSDGHHWKYVQTWTPTPTECWYLLVKHIPSVQTGSMHHTGMPSCFKAVFSKNNYANYPLSVWCSCLPDILDPLQDAVSNTTCKPQRNMAISDKIQ